MKGSRVEISTGRDHSPFAVTDNRLNLGRKGSLSHHQSNQRRIVRNKSRFKTSSPHPFLLPGRSFTQVHSLLPSEQRRGMGNGGCGQFITRCLCRCFLLRGRTPDTLPLIQCEDSSHRRQFSTNFSNMSPSHGLQLFTNCPSVGPFPRGAVLQEQAAPAWVPHGVTSPASKPAPAWAPLSMSPQVLAGACSNAGSPQGHSLLQASTCSSVGSLS